jgi:hypothetical protein
MSLLGHVEHIHVSLAAGGPMQRLLEADAIAGVGLAETTDGVPDSGAAFHSSFVQVDATGDPELRQPDKTEGWDWRLWHDLPSPLFLPVASFRATGYHPV